ncbi:MAG: WG repeat-containing protein [Methanosarcina sp.]
MKTEDTKRKATTADYEKREQLEKALNENWSEEINDEHLELLESLDWDTELIHEGKKCGLKTVLNEIVLPPVFDDLRLMTGTSGKYYEVHMDQRVVAMKDGKWGVVIADGNGTWIVDPVYDYMGYPNDLTHVCKDGKWGVLNIPEKAFLIEPVCEEVADNSGFLFCNGIGFYKKDGKYGIIEEGGNFTPAIFEDYEGVPEGAVKVKYNGEWGYADQKGQFTTDHDASAYWFDLD